ncbi:hypothetical protein FDENT_8445 [Fusarium denticulatum]|uniref:2EXR domain-containing protein n=1 Tax=Fusarium denticulatum TaxID=48507 RepID=A0A8H5U5Q5_9HYPO|nr:hypothetical protein FDENT_8445 [Fusarium denticulatum]
MASFRRFPDLPKELRDAIWDYASQRNLAGVQIFELQSPDPKQDGQSPDTTNLGASPSGQRLAAPLPRKYFPSLDGSAGTSNVSKYMADIGLWTAYLFVIQPRKIEDVDWSRVARDIRKQLEPRGLFRINIGIELNVQWGIHQEDDYLDLLGDIDKNEINRGTRVFYTCDRRFIEVDWKRQPLKLWQYIKPLERKHRYTGEYESSISLARDLDRIADDLVSDYHIYGQYGEDEDERFNCEVKLLGWDDL